MIPIINKREFLQEITFEIIKQYFFKEINSKKIIEVDIKKSCCYSVVFLVKIYEKKYILKITENNPELEIFNFIYHNDFEKFDTITPRFYQHITKEPFFYRFQIDKIKLSYEKKLYFYQISLQDYYNSTVITPTNSLHLKAAIKSMFLFQNKLRLYKTQSNKSYLSFVDKYKRTIISDKDNIKKMHITLSGEVESILMPNFSGNIKNFIAKTEMYFKNELKLINITHASVENEIINFYQKSVYVEIQRSLLVLLNKKCISSFKDNLSFLLEHLIEIDDTTCYAHGDMNYHNFIINTQELKNMVKLIDFDNFNCSSSYEDIGQFFVSILDFEPRNNVHIAKIILKSSKGILNFKFIDIINAIYIDLLKQASMLLLNIIQFLSDKRDSYILISNIYNSKLLEALIDKFNYKIDIWKNLKIEDFS